MKTMLIFDGREFFFYTGPYTPEELAQVEAAGPFDSVTEAEVEGSIPATGGAICLWKDGPNGGVYRLIPYTEARMEAADPDPEGFTMVGSGDIGDLIITDHGAIQEWIEMGQE